GRREAVRGAGDDQEREIEGLERHAVVDAAGRARERDAIGAREDVEEELDARRLEGFAEELVEDLGLHRPRTPPLHGARPEREVERGAEPIEKMAPDEVRGEERVAVEDAREAHRREHARQVAEEGVAEAEVEGRADATEPAEPRAERGRG